MTQFSEIMDGVKKVLLVEPKFIGKKKTRQKNYSIAFVKIGSYCQQNGIEFEYMRLEDNKKILPKIDPEVIFISSLFTYQCDIVKQVVDICKEYFPEAKTVVGGIYANLMPEHCREYANPDYVISSIIDEVENIPLDYSFVDSDFQMIQLSRGCTKKCKFCAVHHIEPEYQPKSTFINGVQKRRLLFLDNNFLANPHIDEIFDELDELKMYQKITNWEAVSGVDIDYLLHKPELAKRMKRSGCINLRIAWDGSIKKAHRIKKAIDLFEEAGFDISRIRVFMLYNYRIPFEECEKKRVLCYKWGVRVYQCRYIPITATSDGFNQRKKQTSEDYYIHDGWTDEQVKLFNINCRNHFISIYNKSCFYSKTLHTNKNTSLSKNELSRLSFEEAKELFPDAWNPAVEHLK